MMPRITKWSTLAQVKRCPGFEPFREYLNPFKGIQGITTNYLPFALGPGWNGTNIASGFERLYTLCSKGHKVFYPLYTAEECRQNPALSKAAMFHFPGKPGAPFVMVAPGGGYEMVCSMFEGFPLANTLNQMGYHTFVVNYRVSRDALAPNPQDDLAAAVRYVLDHADDLGVSPDGYAVAGFSAGGHLAGSFGTKSRGWQHYGLPCPAVLFLGYPVITMGEHTHQDSRKNLLGSHWTQEDVQKWSLELQADGDMPPVYLWQYDADKVVSINNSKLLYARLKECGVPCEYEVFHGTLHGCGKDAEGWLNRAVAFWRQQIKSR